jgi:acetyl-CoA decarbonylase/synthase complex subunit beta
LKEKNHPVVAKWKEEIAEVEQETMVESAEQGLPMPVMSASTLPIMAGGFKIILKDAKIYANKVIIKTIKDEKTKK